jgi:hypothetical protein
MGDILFDVTSWKDLENSVMQKNFVRRKVINARLRLK